MRKLINHTPLGAFFVRDGWCLLFGEAMIGKTVGAVYLTPQNPYYLRSLVVFDAKQNFPVCKSRQRRLLTPEEVEHFTKWAEAWLANKKATS